MKKLKGIFGGKGKGGATNQPVAHNSSESPGYFVKDKDLSKIHKAAWSGDIAKVKQLAKKDSSSLDKENRSPLHLACVQGHANVVQELLEWRANTSLGDNNGRTPLMKAVECGHEACVKLLLEYHADVDIPDRDNNSALHLAVEDGKVDIANTIIQAGAKLNTRNKMGFTPLHMSIKNKRDELTRVLLENNADPNIADKEYRTPLHHACNEDAINHVKLLLQYNASTAMKDARGWTAEDCAMMKANHGCSQLVYDHNLKQQKTISRSVPATPRSGSSVPPSSQSTPRDRSFSDFGMPQAPKEETYDSDDPTLSKGSVHEDRLDSWADNTDVSSAMDDNKDKPAVKTSLVKHVNLDDSDEELRTGNSLSEGSRKSPGPRPGSGDIGGSVRPMYSRTPTPDGTTSPIDRPGSTSPMPVGGTPKKTLKQTVSGTSHTTVEEDFTDDDDDDDPQPIQRNRVSFKQENDIKNISTEDDSDADEEDEEEIEPSKKRRIETPEEASGYLPPGVSNSSTPTLSQEKMRDMMKDLGLEDNISDLSDEFDSESYVSPRDASHGTGSQPTTPRSILKPPKTDAGKPPSIQQAVETDDEDWDSTQASETDRGHQQVVELQTGQQSPEYDSDLEGTLNPDNSHIEKEEHHTDDEAEEIADSVVANTVDITQDNDDPVEDKLANTGEINLLEIKELNESTDWSLHGSRSSSGALDAPVAMTVIDEEKTEISDSSQRSDNTMKTQISVKRFSKTDSGSDHIKIRDHVESGEDTSHKISHVGNTDTLASKVSIVSSDDINSLTDKITMSGSQSQAGETKENLADNKAEETDAHGSMDEDDGHADDECEVDSIVKEEMNYYDNIEKFTKGKILKKQSSEESHAEKSIKEEKERSHSEGRDKSSSKSIHSGEFQVMDRNKAPKCMFEYEPSTTEAETDSDTVDTVSIHEDFNKKKTKTKKTLKHSPKNVLGKGSKDESLSLASDKEVARALVLESPTTFSKRQMVASAEDFINRASVEPTTADTMEDQASLEEEDGEETSQWDSTDEAYTPRTPRDEAHFNGEATSPGVVDFDEDEEEEEEVKEVSIQDQINDAVTSFSVKPTNQMPEQDRDTPSSRSRDTPETPTISTNSAAQKTVIAAVVMEPSPRDDEEEEEEQEAGDSDWDSEDEVHSGMDTPIIDVNKAASTPRTPRGDTTSTVSDPESASEWEIEKERQKEQEQRKMEEEEEARRKQHLEIENQRQREEEERNKALQQREEEERKILAEMAAEQEQQRQWEEEEQQRQWEEEERERLAEIEEEEERQRQWEEEERKRLAEIEEEEERQKQWEEEERRRQDALRREAEAELEQERLSQDQVSDISDFSDDDQGHFVFDQKLQQHQDSFSDQPSQRSDRSQKSQHSEVNLPSARSDKESPLAGLTSPRVIPPELKRPPPKLVVSSFITSPNSQKDSRHPVQMGEVENESPAPVYENLVQTREPGINLYASPPPDSQIITPPSENRYALDNQEAESDVGVEDINEEEVDDELEHEIEPVLDQHMTVLHRPMESSEPPRTTVPTLQDVDREIQLLGTPPPLPVTEPPGGKRAMSLRSDGNSADEDELDDLDLPGNKIQGRSSLNFPPELSGTTGLYMSGLDVPFDDDGLSVTSTENGDISSSYRPESLPYGKDMLVNMNLSDSNAVLKLQEHLREHRRQLEHERGQKSLLENKHKLMVKEKAQMQKTIDSLKYQKSALEQAKLDLEAKIRNLEYSVNEEEEKRKNAELLLKKTKDHLTKKEEQFTQEMEAKQSAELSMRNVQMELRSAQNTIREIEEEKREIERKLVHEKNARGLQEKINDEQQRLQQHMHEESLKTSSQRDDDSEEAKSALELADDSIKYNRDLVDKYKNEAIALKAELQRQRQRLTDENSIMSGEVEKLTQRVEDLKSEVRLNEEALTQLTLQNNLQQNKLMGEVTMLSNNLDKERVAREKLEAELESSRNRLQITTSQLEKAQQARSDFERRLHSDREEWARQLERKEQELEVLKDKLQTVMHTLNATESKLNAVENELQISNTTLLERTNQQQQANRDMQYYKTSQENFDANLRHEKEQNAKLHGKIENLQERVSSLQHDNLNLKQQFETAQNVANDRSGLNLQDKLNTMISNLKADHEKARASLEEKNNNLQDTISRLREEIRNSENKRSNLEQDIRKYNQEQNDLIRKLSIAEASLEMATKARDQLEQDRMSMKMELEQMQQKYHQSQERTIEAQTKVNDLVGRLDKTEQSRLMSTQQLADTSATMNAFNNSKAELEENYQKLQVENVRLDAELKHEKQKTEMLNKDLQDSQKVRSSLEALCSNLKSTNAHLEEKLGPGQLQEVTASSEVTSRKFLLKDAEDHKGLWEQEVISRSKLGMRIAQLERHKQETATQLEEEKRKTRKAAEQKRLAESKLEAEQERCSSLQKEVANLKAYLKVAKRKLKALDTNENRVSNLHSAFDKERQAMEEMLVSVKSQLELMKIQLQEEMEEKEKVHQKNVQLENELKTIKKLERSVQKIDRSKRKLEQEFQTYKSNVEVGYLDKASVEESRKEVENRYRLELNRKLDEVNNYLEEQARTRQKLDSSRDEQETKLRNEKRRLEEDLTDVRIKYEQSVAQKESKDLEAKRYRDLYESEMQWRMRLTEQLYSSTDKSFGLKNKLVAERQKNRLFGSLNNLSGNGHTLDLSRVNGSFGEDALSSKLRAELDRSIAKHLEAAPHDQYRPVLRADDPVLAHSNFAKANAEYIEVLKRKYCV